MKNSDYRDYVIKNGKLIGDFENMYKDCHDPWEQESRQDESEIKIMLSMLNHNSYNKILECGCGLGYIANKLSPFGMVLGIDLSKTAIEKAKTSFPHIEFDTCNIVNGIDSRNENQTTNTQEKFDLIVLSRTLWYVIEEIDKIFLDIADHLTEGGEFLLNLPYPLPLNENYYGKEILPDEQSLIEYVRKYFDVINYAFIREEFKKDTPIVIVHAKSKSK